MFLTLVCLSVFASKTNDILCCPEELGKTKLSLNYIWFMEFSLVTVYLKTSNTGDLIWSLFNASMAIFSLERSCSENFINSHQWLSDHLRWVCRVISISFLFWARGFPGDRIFTALSCGPSCACIVVSYNGCPLQCGMVICSETFFSHLSHISPTTLYRQCYSIHSYHLQPLFLLPPTQIKTNLQSSFRLIPFPEMFTDPMSLNDHGISVTTHHLSWCLMHLSLICKRSFTLPLNPFMDSLHLILNYKLCKQSVHKEYQCIHGNYSLGHSLSRDLTCHLI